MDRSVPPSAISLHGRHRDNFIVGLPSLCYEDRSLMQISLDLFQSKVLILTVFFVVPEVCASILACYFLLEVFLSALKALVFLSTR